MDAIKGKAIAQAVTPSVNFKFIVFDRTTDTLGQSVCNLLKKAQFQMLQNIYMYYIISVLQAVI